jgi:2-polyprenyl-3-methyl-5-hydroxy-6-metoxy-1,4-benzoquinol methylase
MTENFEAPCAKYYSCPNKSLKLYAQNDTKVDFVRCDSCGLIWRDLSTCSEERIYDEAYFQRMGYCTRRQHRIDKAHMLFEILEQHVQAGKMLEVGPGLGYNMEAAKERGWKAEGLDISDYVTEYLKSTGLDCYKGSLVDCRQITGKYDTIFMKHVLEHYKDPFAALTRTRELLEDDGVVQIVVPNAKYRKAVKLRGRHRFYSYEKNGIEHYVYFDKDTLRRLLESTGFQILQQGLPLLVKRNNTPYKILNRAIRRSMSAFDLDQELFAVAKKTH